MIGYLGTPGVLGALRYKGGLSTSTERPASFSRTMGGKRKGFLGPEGRREWDVSFDLLGSRDVFTLLAASQANEPLLWYPADAVAGNLLSPQASGWVSTPSRATASGLAQLPDGTVARTIASESTVSVGEWAPVRAGEPVTVGAWSTGGQHFRGFWYGADGSSVGNYFTPKVTHSGWTWHEATVTPPDGAVYILLQLAGGTQYARPSVTWGESAVDRPGRGCPAAVVHGLSESLLTMTEDDAYGSISVTITEVG